MQTRFEGSIFFSSIKSYIQKICSVSLVRETLRVSFSLFWTRPSTKNFYKITQNSSFSVTLPEHTKYNLLGQYAVDRLYNQRNVNGQRQLIFLLQQLGFVLNLKKSVLTPTQRIEFLGVTVDSLTMTLSLLEKKVSKVLKHCLELLQKTQVLILELTKLIGILSSIIQALLPAQINFRYLQQQQMQPLKTEGSNCKKLILKRSSKEELQWRVQNLKICNGCYLIQSHSQVLIQRDQSRKGWSAVCQRISTGWQWSREEQLLHINKLELKAVKLVLLTFNKQKSLKAVHFQIDNTTVLLYLVKMGGTGNQMLLHLSKKIETPDHNSCRIPSKFFECGG